MGILLLLPPTSGCRSPKNSPPVKPVPASSPAPPTVKYNRDYDEDIKAIFNYAERGLWEQAEKRAYELHFSTDNDPTTRRLYEWVLEQRQSQREKAIEDKIRSIEADDSVFNPTIETLLTEHKNRGLPPRKDLRDAVQQIESTPYVPKTFGQTITQPQQGKLFSLDNQNSAVAGTLNKRVTMHLDDVTLETIIFEIGKTEGLNFIADRAMPAFKEKISVHMDQVTLREFLRYISRNFSIQFQVGEDLIWIVDAKDTAKLLEETRFYRLKKGFIIPGQFGASDVNRTTVDNKGVVTITETQKIDRFVPDGAPIQPSIVKAIENFFKGTFYIDYERNLIVARGTPDELANMERIIDEFDRAVQQVLIEARFVTVSEAAFLQFGVNWETGRDPKTLGRAATDFTGLGTNVGLGLQETFTNILSRDNLSATLTALEQEGESQTLSAPRITLVNNLPATISDGKVQYYYEEYQVKQEILERRSTSSLVPTGKPSKVTSGVHLNVVASISGDGQSVMLALNPQVNQDVQLVTFATLTDVNDQGNVVSQFDIRLPESRTQEISTRVVVKSGETVVMGGVLERQQSTFVESVPLLGNLPLIGALFRKRTEIDKPRYLLIFVTATILSDSGEFITYEPSTNSGPNP